MGDSYWPSAKAHRYPCVPECMWACLALALSLSLSLSLSVCAYVRARVCVCGGGQVHAHLTFSEHIHQSVI